MVLAKTDMGIAARYAGLVKNRKLRAPPCSGASSASTPTRWPAVFAITGTKTLLEGNPSLARSLRNRTPYIDPLNHLQIELLGRLRAGRGDAHEIRRAVHLTITRRRRRPAQQRLGRAEARAVPGGWASLRRSGRQVVPVKMPA